MTVKALRNVDEEKWAEFKAAAASRKMPMNKLFNEAVAALAKEKSKPQMEKLLEVGKDMNVVKGTKLERARGTRDFAAEEALLRQEIVATLRSLFELYGYSPIDTPILERFETLSAKYAGGEEILKETFKLKDQGDRELGLRYDLTVPMCRFIATNPNLKMPFKRYQIGSVFRDGPLKIGRYREFAQCDVDIVGVKPMAAEVELIKLAVEAFEKLKISVTIKINSRKILNSILEILDQPREFWNTIILALDKLEKVGWEAVEAELKQKGLSRDPLTLLRNTLANNTFESLRGYIIQVFNQQMKEFEGTEFEQGFNEIEQIIQALKNQDITKVKFEGTLARGLSYYTGTIFEVTLNESEIKSSIAAGGRYDKMIGDFVGSGREYPAVGISFGLDIIQDALLPARKSGKKTATVAYVIPIKIGEEAQKIAAQLRKAGVNTDIDMNSRDIKRNLEYAAAAGIPFAILVGDKEVKSGKVTVREMKSGSEKSVTIPEAAEMMKP